MNSLHSDLKKYVIPENSSINDIVKCKRIFWRSRMENIK